MHCCACPTFRPTEFWAAYIDPNTGWGLGVYNPMAWMGITAYRIGPDGADSRPWDCSYFAHTIRMQLHPGMKAYPYTVYITGVCVGRPSVPLLVVPVGWLSFGIPMGSYMWHPISQSALQG
jgi:hypothetical protein